MQRECKWLVLATTIPFVMLGAAAAQQPGILGIYNPATHEFQPVPVQAAPSSGARIESGVVGVRSGTLKATFTITVKNGTADSVKPSCYFYAYHQPAGHSYYQSESMTGTRTGNTAKCVAVIHYRWAQADTAIPVTFSAYVYVGNWQTQIPLDPIPLPANGAVTNISADVVI